jgi:hypothetical protein
MWGSVKPSSAFKYLDCQLSRVTLKDLFPPLTLDPTLGLSSHNIWGRFWACSFHKASQMILVHSQDRETLESKITWRNGLGLGKEGKSRRVETEVWGSGWK